MNITKSSVVGVILGLTLVSSACGRSNNSTPDAGPGGGSDSGPAVIHIQDVQNDAMKAGTSVDLHGVIVTAIDSVGARNGEIWVEEPAGGSFSGVAVFGAPLSQISGLAVGDIVNIIGAAKSEFVINGDNSGRSLTELVNPAGGGMMTITKTGTGTVPAPAVVDALAIGVKATQAERDVEWEKWEGVLITVTNVSASAAPTCIKSKGNCTDVDSFGITGVVNVESGLAAFPAVQPGDCFSSITGVVDYAFGYVLYPRSTTEMVTGGTSCVLEKANGATNTCIDGMDNDGNGFADCKDFSCEVGPGAWLGATCTATDATCGCSANLPALGVNKVNTGTAGAVLLHDVIVTAVGKTGYWVADAAQAVANGGVLVFSAAVPDASIVVGAKLGTLQGIAGPFDASKTASTKSVIEITRPTVDAITTSGAAILPITTASVAVLVDPTNGAAFAGSLVQLQNLKVKTVDAAKQIVTLTDNAGATITMTDRAYATFGGTEPAVNDCFTTLTGVMDFNTNEPQTRTINPTGPADMVKGTGCN